MGRRRRKWGPDVIARRIAEGRGLGIGPNYIPWHLVQDFPSFGRIHRIRGWKANRVHHLFSDLEANALLVFELIKSIIDIREQFPLLDPEETLSIASRLGIKHPSDPYTKYPVVMSTDFLLTIRRGVEVVYHARTMKYEADLNDHRVLEKFEIERLYWEARNVNWGYITEKNIPPQLVENARLLHPFISPTDLYPLTAKQITRISSELTQHVRSNAGPICEIASNCDQKFGLATGKSLAIVRHLLAVGTWRIDLMQPIRFDRSLVLL
jgi:hypothetical protein